MGHFASLPLFAGVFGDGAGGWLTDYLLKRTGNIRFARRALAVTEMLGAAACIVPAAMTRNPYTAVYCLTAAMLFLECIIGPAWAVPIRKIARNLHRLMYWTSLLSRAINMGYKSRRFCA
jgi:hypothetical protein